MKLTRLLRQRKTWMILVPVLAVIMLLALIFGDPLSGSALERYKMGIMGVLIAPIIATLYSYIQMMIDEQVYRRVSGLLQEEENAESPAASRARRAEADAAAEDEVASIAENLKTAMATLRKRGIGGRGGRRLYQLPWYTVIGPPGSGKTTAILNSGLRFPLAGRHGSAPLRGVGGTRHCDWWFTDKAVLIDTAGRYSTQDEPDGTERGAWLGFLRLLRKHRRREPVNGILVVIGLDLIAGPAAARHDHALRIRERVREIHDELGLRVPVYVIVSKLDLVDGFMDFFSVLGNEGRDAVWGITFDMPGEAGETRPVSPCDAFRTEFDVLVDRVDGLLVDRLQQESDGARRGAIFGFPQRVASLRDSLAEFLDEAFQPNSYEDPVLLRGLYLTSGTQPPQRAAALMKIDPNGRPAAMAQQSPAADDAAEGQSYFLNRLLRDVVFHEAGLVAADPAKLRRRRRGVAVGHAAIAALALVMGGWVIAGYLRNSAAATELSGSLQDVSERAMALNPAQVAEPAFPKIVPLIDTLQAARDRAGESRTGQALFDRAGRIPAAGHAGYDHALQKLLLPRLVLAAEQAMTRDTSNPAALYQALKVYLMLGGRGPLQADVVNQWAATEALTTMPGDENAPLRDALLRHVAALSATPFEAFAVDDKRIADARAALPERSAAARVLEDIVTDDAARELPAWRLVQNAGPEANRVFADRRGAIEAATVPGIYTRIGFHTVFLPNIGKVATAEARDLWVLEDQLDDPQADPGLLASRLAADATELYLRDASLRWDQTLSAITIRPLQTLGDALRVMNTLSSPSSPIRLLLVSIVDHTAFDRAPPPPAATEEGQAPADPLAGDAIAQQSRQRAATFATEHFREVRSLIEVPGNSQQGAVPPVDQVIADLQTLYRQLRDVDSTDLGGPLDAAAEARQVLRQVTVGSAQLPQPVRGWVADISATSVSQQTSSARDTLNQRWQDGPAALCREVTDGRYPFSARARTDTDLNRFGALFGPGGALDQFTRTNLDNIVDRSGSEWRWREVEGIAGALNPDALTAMEQAARIRDVMFAGNAQRPSVGFQMTLTELEPPRAPVRVVMNGQNTELRQGQSQSIRMHWPGPERMGRASVSFPQFMGNREPGIATNGDWALYRLLDQAKGNTGNARDGTLRVRFQIGDRVAGFVLQTDTALNALDRSLFSGFRCPESF